MNTIPLAQLYEVHYDMQRPYRVCGGLQDNGSWCGPSRTTYQQGISNEDWFRVGGGDGFYTVLDPTDPNVVYSESQDGNVGRLNLATDERRVIRPEPPAGERYRFNWNSPIVVSPHDHRTIWYGGNRLFGSRDRGDTWTIVSPDLTNAAERDKMTIFGKTAKEMMSRNDGVVHFGTITTLAESPVKAGVLWIGTDDGNLAVSRDGGASWSRLKLPAGVPAGTYVSRVEAGHAAEGTAYLSFDGHRGDDYGTYVFKTTDFGQTWRSIAGNITKGSTVRVVREHPKNPDLLFVGTEFALWTSADGGAAWQRVKGKLPTVPVSDIQIHPRDNDLILGTHGRGIFVLDELNALAQMSRETTSSDLALFDVEPAIQWRMYGHKGNTGSKFMLGPNPPEGALVSYWLKAKPGEKDEVKVTVTDASGAVVREIKGPKEKGLNQASWDLRAEPPVTAMPGAEFFGPPRGPFVAPGTYTVKVALGSSTATRTVTVEEDPRLSVSAADRAAWQQALEDSARLWKRADAANKALTGLKKQLTDLEESQKKAKPSEDVKKAVADVSKAVDALARRVSRQEPLGFAGAPLAEDPDPLLGRARGLYFGISSITAPPTASQQRLMGEIGKQVDEVAAAVNAVVEKQVPELNRMLLERGIGRLDPGTKVD